MKIGIREIISSIALLVGIDKEKVYKEKIRTIIVV